MRQSLQELAAALRDERLPLERYLLETLEFIAAREHELHALIPEDKRRERLLRQAAELIDIFPDKNERPPLFGVLVGVKDLYNVDGLPTRAGSRLPAEAFAGPEAALVTRLKEAGALILGKTVSTEFAYFSPGPTRNPLNPEHTPGGSSSGSAAAVAAGYCHLALGTQTIASVVRPAAYCGICGFKPSFGRVSLAGVFPFSQSADHVGWFAPSAEDLSFAATIILPHFREPGYTGLPGLGIVSGPYLAQAEKAARDDFYTHIGALAADGYEYLELDIFNDIEAINASHRRLIAAEFARNHLRLWKKYSELYSSQSRELYKTGVNVTDAELAVLRDQQIVLRNQIEHSLRKLSLQLILTPSTPNSAPLSLQSTGSPLMSLPFNHAGLPLLTLPAGIDSKGLPFGMQICGLFGKDEFVLRAARDIEAVLIN